MDFDGYRRVQALDAWLLRAGRQFARRIDRLQGFGLIFYFWAVVMLLLGGLVLVFGGLAAWNGWLVLGGLLALRLCGQGVVLGAKHLRMLEP